MSLVNEGTCDDKVQISQHVGTCLCFLSFLFLTLFTFQVNLMAIFFLSKYSNPFKLLVSLQKYPRKIQIRFFYSLLLSPRISYHQRIGGWFGAAYGWGSWLGWDVRACARMRGSFLREGKLWFRLNFSNWEELVEKEGKLWFSFRFFASYYLIDWWEGSTEICGSDHSREGNPEGEEANDLFPFSSIISIDDIYSREILYAYIYMVRDVVDNRSCPNLEKASLFFWFSLLHAIFFF